MRQYPLPNGLTVVLVPFSHPAVVAVFGCRAGYRFDPLDKPGLSHTIEHVKWRLAVTRFGRRRPRHCDTFSAQTDTTSITFALRTASGRAPWMIKLLADGLVKASRQRAVVRKQLETIREEAAEHQSETGHLFENDFLQQFGVSWSDRPEKFQPSDVESFMR